MLDAADQAVLKATVEEAIQGAWVPPTADSPANAIIWVVAVGALAILLLAFGLGFVYEVILGGGNPDPLNPMLTLLVGGFLGFVGGTKAPQTK